MTKKRTQTRNLRWSFAKIEPMTTNKQQTRNLLSALSRRTYVLAILMATALVGCSEKELTVKEILYNIKISGVTELYLETYLEDVFLYENYIECLSDDDLHPLLEGKEMLYIKINKEKDIFKQKIGNLWITTLSYFKPKVIESYSGNYSYFSADNIELDRELLTATRILVSNGRYTIDYTCRILSEIEIRELEMQFIATRKKQQIDKEKEEELKAKEEAEQKAKNKI